MEKPIIGIYKITNLSNNKIYIGQSINIYQRYKAHQQYALNPKSREYNTPIHNAIRKYGIQNFQLEILEQCTTEQLDEKEIYWINYYNSTDRAIGYNLTNGGMGGRKTTCQSILQYDLNGNFIQEWSSIWKAAETLNITESNIRACCCGQKSAGGFQWKYKNDNKIISQYKRNIYYPGLELGRKLQPITAYKDNFQIYFNSIKEGAQWLIDNNYLHSQLPSICSRISTIKNTKHQCGGFYWVTTGGDD